ncbi:multicopper oxidase domain-containing protein [Glaesserella sp.]|uniref:multicopper oxidase domain-containing protein n=1 Tax=Glaesserella sp. TaxID=2094731 RepID=UPI00359F9C35
MKISRRQFLKRTSLAGVVALAPKPLLAKERAALSIPPLIDIGRGRPIRLDFRAAQAQFDKGKLVDVWGANGRYLAPTVRVKSGDFVRLTYINSLPQAINIHIQGLLAPTEMVGSVQRKLEPSTSWSPILSVNQPACTCWYHADTLFNSAFQVYRGLAGFWFIEDNESRKAQLPNQYGVNDIPLILQDQQINKNGVQVLNTQSSQFFGKRLFVNGQESPYFNAPRGWVRLRLVNASLSRTYDLRLDNGKPLYQIGTGLGMFAEPIEMEHILLAPSERVELLVDLNDGEKVSLMSGEERGFFYSVGQFFSDDNDLQDNVVLELRPEGLPSALNTTPQLPPFNLEQFALKVTTERKLTLRPTDRLINQQRFDPKRIDFEVEKGSVERWYIRSNEAIGFTLQGAKFIIETRNREKMPHNQLAWRDTVWIEKDQEVTLLIKFEHSASEKLPFTFGVSDLMLKDRGCLGQFTVS